MNLKIELQENAKDAAIEVNYWCAEEATYHSGDDRTLPALTVYRRGYGRCGEESVFLVNALRSVGIPARQVYVQDGPTVMTIMHGWSFGVMEMVLHRGLRAAYDPE